MLDQSFSAHNFEVIFTMENRKGHIDITMMSQAYQDVLTEIKNAKMQVQNIRKKKNLIELQKKYWLWRNLIPELKICRKKRLRY